MKGLRIYRDNELIAYAAKKITIAIFHLGGGFDRVFKSGSVNNVSKPVDVS
ncbi:MAG TPA: hypothetical protein VE619_06905 [Nitrososphaeraceae archaeon]|nr:hypothetical protein [Nitrososphaeraceae archaeon]